MQENKKPEGVLEDLKNAVMHDFNSSFKVSNQLDQNNQNKNTQNKKENTNNLYIRRGNDFSADLSTKTMIKILVPLVVLFVVGFLVYTFFFYSI